MPNQALESILASLQSTKTLIIGDIMLDRFVTGYVDRISPESPVPVLAVKSQETMLGGAGNALSNLAGLGAQGQIIAVVGDDSEAAEIAQNIENIGFSAAHLVKDPSRQTIVKTRYLAGHQQLLRTDFEHKSAVSKDIEEQVLEVAQKAIKDCNAMILSDYGKGLLSDTLIKSLIDAAKKENIPAIVDPKGTDFSKYQGATAVTPNKKELAEAANMPTNSDEEVLKAATHIIESCGIEAVIATRSADGMSVIQKGESPTHIRTTDIEVFDVSGAGDTVIATIAASVGAGASLAEAAKIANIAGSIVVTKVGTAPIRIEELKDAAAENTASQGTDRTRRGEILGWDAAADQIKRWKARGLKVGFTNGCFDIVHFGHVTYLNDARDHCDRLVMGLNTDSSIRILKGPDRPVHDEHSRAGVIAALGSIDMVVMFGAQKQAMTTPQSNYSKPSNLISISKAGTTQSIRSPKPQPCLIMAAK